MAKTTKDTAQTFQALREEILRGDIKPFYLLFGKEHYYIDELCKLLTENVIPPEERDFGQIVYYGADVTANQVVSTARQFPMMVSRQLVVVKEAQMMKKVEDIGVYFEGIQPTTVLVICYKTNNDPTRTGKNIDKRTAFYKQAQKIGVVFESEQIPDYRVARWIESYVAGEGLSIAPDASALLAEFAGNDLSKVVLSLDKLRKVLPEDRRNISVRDVEENVGMSRDYSVFELTKALSLKDAAECPHFVITSLPLKEPAKVAMEPFKSCVVYTCLAGGVRVETGGNHYTLTAGETLLVPATADDLLLIPDASGAHLLQTHLPQPPKEDIYDGPEL